MLPKFQIDANNKFNGMCVGIYCSKNANGTSKLTSVFPKMPMIVSTNNNIIETLYMRDLDFAFTVRDNNTFKIGLFLYNPNNIKLYNISDYYIKNGVLPHNVSSIHDLGTFTIDFSSNSYDEMTNHFKAELCSDDGNNYVEFDFYAIKLDKIDKNNKDKDLYYLSNPYLKFNLENV